MIEWSGKSYFTVPDAVTGRMCQADKVTHEPSDSARILIWNGECDLMDAALSTAVGVVFPNGLSDSKLKSALRVAEFCRLPALRVNCTHERLSQDSQKKIAILDTAGGKLFVNPDLETINSYLGRKKAKKARNVCFLSEYSVNAPSKYCDTQLDGTVIRIECSQRECEEQLYEMLCDVADTHTGMQIVGVASFNGREAFSTAVRAVYRAGVWGRFSLLCDGIYTPEQANECLSVIHREFCRLDAEGREFNGFIPKGICIATPLLLLSSIKSRMIDFFCADFQALRRLLSGSADKTVGEKQTAQYITAFLKASGEKRLALKGVGGISSESLHILADTDCLCEIYADAQTASTLKRWL